MNSKLIFKSLPPSLLKHPHRIGWVSHRIAFSFIFYNERFRELILPTPSYGSGSCTGVAAVGISIRSVVSWGSVFLSKGDFLSSLKDFLWPTSECCFPPELFLLTSSSWESSLNFLFFWLWILTYYFRCLGGWYLFWTHFRPREIRLPAIFPLLLHVCWVASRMETWRICEGSHSGHCFSLLRITSQFRTSWTQCAQLHWHLSSFWVKCGNVSKILRSKSI